MAAPVTEPILRECPAADVATERPAACPEPRRSRARRDRAAVTE